MELPWFAKAHGLGNDYMVFDARQTFFDFSEANIRLLCDRHQGIGSDGILLLMPSEVADFGVRIFNPDGSEAEKSGNGLRILAYVLRMHGYTQAERITIETATDVVRATFLLAEDGRVERIAVEMGKASFQSRDIPVSGPDREVVDESLDVDGNELKITAVSVGNPHCVVVVDDVTQVPLHTLGPALENHRLFPRRTNVQFAQVLDRSTIRIRIWERGAGHTLASGSSASAAVAALHRLGKVDGRVRVEMEGGDLEVRVEPDGTVTLVGPVEEVYTGRLSADLLRRLG